MTRIVEETEIPITQFLPTHANRTPELFEACVAFAKRGGTIDFTASEDPDFWEKTDGGSLQQSTETIDRGRCFFR